MSSVLLSGSATQADKNRHHGNTQIRQVAAEHLVGYSQADLPLFKRNQLEPVKDLKLLVKDYAPIAKNALTILINISHDGEVLKSLANDDAFLETLLSRTTVCQFIGAKFVRGDTDGRTEQEGAECK